jgi:GntR family transcriptional regulator
LLRVMAIASTDGLANGLAEGDLAPRYHRVRAHLRRRIETGEWRAGEQIPPEPVLMQEFGVSRGTVRQAVDALVRHGLLQREQGRGTFVRRPPVAAGLGDFFHFLEDLRLRGFAVTLRLVRRGVVPADETVARLLAVPAGTPLVVIRRLVLLDGEPFRLDDYHVAHDRFAGLLDDDVERNYVATLLETRYGVRLTRQQKWIEPVSLGAEEAALLEVSTGEPALLIESLAYGVRTGTQEAQATGVAGTAAGVDTAGAPPVVDQSRGAEPQPVEFRRMLMRRDKCRFFIEVERA